MVKEDNEKLLGVLDEGGDPKLISIETLDENEPVHIEMNVVKEPFEVGVVEHGCDRIAFRRMEKN
jgi:transcriptional regulator